MSVTLIKAPAVGTFLARRATGVAYKVISSYTHTGHAYATIQEPSSGPFTVSTASTERTGLDEWHALDTFRPATTREIEAWYAVNVIMNGGEPTTTRPTATEVDAAAAQENFHYDTYVRQADRVARLELELNAARVVLAELSVDADHATAEYSAIARAHEAW